MKDEDEAAELHRANFSWMKDPEFEREYERYKARLELADRLTSWMKRIPYIGSLVYVFWFCILTEGPYLTMKPRWGALTFSFLNDGQGATVWHTWRQIRYGNDDPYTGIYVDGAPSSMTEAKSLERLWDVFRS